MKKSRTTTLPSSQDGAALSVTLVVMLILGMIAASVMQTVLSHQRVAAAQLHLEQALFAAEAGLAEAAQVLAEADGFLSQSATHGSGSIGDATFGYRIQQQPGWKQFSVHATGTVNGVSRRIDVDRAYFPTFASYAMWTRANGVMYFGPGEVFDGLIHSDDPLYFASSEATGGPVFHGMVTSADETYHGSISHVDFRDGFELGVTNGSLADVNFNWLRDRAAANGLALSGPTRIRLNGNQMLITNEANGWTNHAVTVQTNFLVYVADDPAGAPGATHGVVELDGGILDGRMTVVSDHDITIRDHVRYAQDPRNDDIELGVISRDALGLVSRNDILVGTDAPDNLEIFAALLATGRRVGGGNGSFSVVDFDLGTPRGALTIYGSLAQSVRGPVGRFNSGGVISGFYKNYSFDRRFTREAPPYYPEIANRVLFSGWSDGPVL